MNNQSHKALQKLGLSTELLLEAFLGTQNARDDLTRQEFTVFWSVFSELSGEKAVEKATQLFFRELLSALLDTLDLQRELRACSHS